MKLTPTQWGKHKVQKISSAALACCARCEAWGPLHKRTWLITPAAAAPTKKQEETQVCIGGSSLWHLGLFKHRFQVTAMLSLATMFHTCKEKKKKCLLASGEVTNPIKLQIKHCELWETGILRSSPHWKPARLIVLILAIYLTAKVPSFPK